MANNVRKKTRVTSKDSQSNLKYTIDVGLRGISTRTNTNETRQGHSGTGAAGSAGLRRTTVGSRPSKSRCLHWLTAGCWRKGPPVANPPTRSTCAIIGSNFGWVCFTRHMNVSAICSEQRACSVCSHCGLMLSQSKSKSW